MLRSLLNESLSSDAFEGTPSKKAFQDPHRTSHVHPINRLTPPSWRDTASTGQMWIEICDVMDVFRTVPLHVSAGGGGGGLQSFDWIYGEAVWSGRYLVFSNVGVICIGLPRTIPFPRGKFRACTLF